MFGPIFKYIGFSYNKNICTFHLQNLITVVKIAQMTWFFVHLQNLIVQKSCGSRNFDFFLPFLKFWSSKFQKIDFFKFGHFLSQKAAKSWKKSKIQKSGLYKIFWFLNPVTRPKISKFCWLLKPELNLKGLFFRWKLQFFGIWGVKNWKIFIFFSKNVFGSWFLARL